MVAEGIRRDQDLSEMSHTDADSDAGLPDDSDDAEDVMEVQCVMLYYTVMCCFVLCCTVVYCTVLYCAVLCCTVLRYACLLICLFVCFSYRILSHFHRCIFHSFLSRYYHIF